ncbi:MAG: response regulator, partial [Halobacteriovoraceae bacterium]|nr:response regulator [Halobacteriovoraceae bacterium]
LIIIDVFLGDQDGFDIVKQLKQTQKYKDIPIMMMSSTMTKQVLLKSIELGASDNIAKPIQNKVLIQKIRKILKDNQLPSVDMTKLKDKNTTTDLKCHGDLIRINEVSCILKSPIKFKENKHPVLESNFLDFLGASKCKVRSVRTSAVAEPGEYNTELTFLGMDEKTSTKIRKIKITP